jgi:hypothetical protein
VALRRATLKAISRCPSSQAILTQKLSMRRFSVLAQRGAAPRDIKSAFALPIFTNSTDTRFTWMTMNTLSPSVFVALYGESNQPEKYRNAQSDLIHKGSACQITLSLQQARSKVKVSKPKPRSVAVSSQSAGQPPPTCTKRVP